MTNGKQKPSWISERGLQWRKPERGWNRRVVKTRKAIREAFRRKLEQGPLKGITVSGRASEADIDRKTFYLHFDSIDDLVDAEVRELLERLVSAALHPEGVGTSPGLLICAACCWRSAILDRGGPGHIPEIAELGVYGGR